MPFDTEIETLKLFINRAERVLRSRLSQNVLSQQLGCKFSWKVGEGTTIEYPDCHEDDRDAFVLSLRLFIQNKDRISIYNVSQIIEDLPLSDAVKEPFRQQRAELNRYLDLHPIFTAFGEPKNYRELLYTLVYGDLSHFDPKLRPMLLKWMADPLVWPHMQTQFLMVCQTIVLCLSAFHTIAQMAIDELIPKQPTA
jgi:hypothetical protein